MGFNSRLLLWFLVSSVAVSLAQAPSAANKDGATPSAPVDEGEYARGFKAGLAEHEKLLDETRHELEQVQKEVEKVKSYNGH